jgi:hypothetical protein
MERTIDDLPMVKVSTLVAAGDIKPGDTAARIRFVDDGVEYVVGVKPWRFKSGGFGAFLVCLRCGGGAQRLRLLDDIPACGKCVRESGLIYRSQATRTEKRHLVTAPVRITRLNGDGPLRTRRPGRKLERRAIMEAMLKRSLLVPRYFGVAEFEERVKRLERRTRDR